MRKFQGPRSPFLQCKCLSFMVTQVKKNSIYRQGHSKLAEHALEPYKSDWRTSSMYHTPLGGQEVDMDPI